MLDVEVGPWTKRWVLFLWEIRRLKHGRAELPLSFQDATELQAGWKKIVTGSDFEGYRWHALRRCGAAVLWFWGARIQTVMLAGGWVTPSVAKGYRHPTHAWSCERRMHLPVPVDWVGGGRAERSSTGQKNDLWTVCGRDGSERIGETLHLSDALGLRRVQSAQRDGREGNPWSPRVPRAQSTTASPAAKANTGSWSVTSEVLDGFGGQVEGLMGLPDVPRKQEGLLAGGLMALGRLAATIDPRKGLARLTQALETISEEGLSQASEESYYDDDEPEPVSLQLARRGIGELGKVRMADTIWRRCVPKDLLRTYQAWDRKYASGIPMVDSLAVGDMLSSIREAGPLKKCSETRGTSKARVIAKNSQKCALIFACVGLNDADWRKPPKFRLPQVEQVTRLMADASRKGFLGKIDPSNCFWSIRMPYRWCRVFRVNTPQGCFRWLTLPFGWKYSPVPCQRLVSALVRRALRDLRARGVTYLDDVLVFAVGRCRLRVAARRVSRVLGRAGFLISPKSVFEPVRTLDFIGKHFSAAAMTVDNKPGVIGGVVALLLLGAVQNRLSARMAARLLGRLEWAVRPNAGLAPFVAGGHCWMLSEFCDFRKGMRRALMTAIAFALNPQCFAPWPWLPQVPAPECVFFTDAAERMTTGRYRIGIVREGKRWLRRKAPKWINTLQQAELYAPVYALRLGYYMRLPYVVIATDSDVGRAPILGMRGSIFLRSQQPLLQQLFWLRSWNDRPMGVFRVSTD